MLKNKKGFTIVEVLVAFAILAVAGTMMTLALRNTTLMLGEATQIKNSTNQLYTDVLNQTIPVPENPSDTVPQTELKVYLKNEGTETITEIKIQEIYVYQAKDEVANTEISLSRIMPMNTLGWLTSSTSAE